MHMKKFLFTLAAAASMMAACTMNIDSAEEKKAEESQTVGFGAYLNRGVSTKAGNTGELTTDVLKLRNVGFGVMAYYTGEDLYNDSCKPDFMYNEKVTWDDNNRVWSYSPIKYWPNQHGESASSEAKDHLTFFAYAPYVAVQPSTGVVTTAQESGITALSRNGASGVPMVRYVASMEPSQCVDLCWGVSRNGLTASVDGQNNHVDKGYPYIDVLKLKTGDKIEFDFNHALTALNVKIDAVIDVEKPTATNPGENLDAATHIYVRSVTFEGFTTKGSLLLNSNTLLGPEWIDYLGMDHLSVSPVTVFDGRRNGKEGIEGSVATDEAPTGLNPVLIQSKPYTAQNVPAGVTTMPVNLFNSATDTASVYVIPNGEPLKITISYDVETKDEKLAACLSDGQTHGSSVPNNITKTVTIDGRDLVMKAGLKYVINLHLGMTSVKFDAVVTGWGNGGSANVDLPQNVE
jgi:hypothetical protein